MKGDFTRNTFDPFRHFSRVLMQQGRVQLDADWNEQAAILLHYLQALAADLIGPCSGPALNCAFRLMAKGSDFSIGRGHYYVDGLLCENDRDDITYFSQADYPAADRLEPGKGYLAYLDVWERHITHLEERAIREVALGGPDTATRAKLVWQVRLTDRLPDGKDIPPSSTASDLLKLWPGWVNAWNDLRECRLRVRLDPGQAYTDPCSIPPDSRYRGQENQLYRVEIHSGGSLKKGRPSFKWSRDNGSIAASWLGNNDDGGLIVGNPRGFGAGQWIEIMGDTEELLARPGSFNRIVRVEGDELYLASGEPFDEKVPRKLRRWNQQETEEIRLIAGAAAISEGTADSGWIDLENGIQIQFQQGGSYRSGDYWLIPARTVGTIEWPGDPKDPDAVMPHGITHRYAPLWAISTTADGKVKIDPKNDMRSTFKALAL